MIARYKISEPRVKIYPRMDGSVKGSDLKYTDFYIKNFHYFVNILDDNTIAYNVQIFYPDGNVETGWVAKHCVTIHWIGNEFDGRFNCKY